jgi:hypothetical protein
MKRRTEPDQLAALQAARDAAHKRLSEAEYAFFQADRALEAEKRRRRNEQLAG